MSKAKEFDTGNTELFKSTRGENYRGESIIYIWQVEKVWKTQLVDTNYPLIF